MLTLLNDSTNAICFTLVAQTQAPGTNAIPVSAFNPWVVFAAPFAWASIWIQIALRFYGKAEQLHKDYHTLGELNSARSAIESNALIPALAQMFERAMAARDDMRRKVIMAELLQQVEFLPDLEAAQSAMSSIEELDQQYRDLKQKSSRIWKWAAGHAVLTPLPVAVSVFSNHNYVWVPWTLSVLGVSWAVSLLMASSGCVRFHKLLGSFNDAIESHGGGTE